MADARFASGFASQVLEKFCELEELAEEILSDKHQITNIDKKRNSNREALNALRKQESSKPAPLVLAGSKSWVCFGNMFLKLPNENTKEMISQDQKNLNEEIESLRRNLKPKVSKLHHLEGQPEIKGFDLKSLSHDELSSVSTVRT